MLMDIMYFKNGIIENVINYLVKCLASLSNPTWQGMRLKK